MDCESRGRSSCRADVCHMRPQCHLLPCYEGCRVQRTFHFGTCSPFPPSSQPEPELTDPQPFLPLVLAFYHSIRHPSQRQYPAWSADSRPRSPLDRVYSFVFDGSTRYIVPSALLSISSFLVIVKTSSLRSTYICPIANSAVTSIPTLQFFGFLLDCIIVQIAYRLVDDGVSPVDDWTIHLQDGTSNHLLIGLTLIVCLFLRK